MGVAAGIVALQLSSQSPSSPASNPRASDSSLSPVGVSRVAFEHTPRGSLDLSCCGLQAVTFRSHPSSITISARSSIRKLDYLRLLSRIKSATTQKRLVLHVVTNEGKLILRAELVPSSRLSAWVAPRLLEK